MKAQPTSGPIIARRSSSGVENRTVDVLLQAGVVAALPYLKRLAAGGKRARPEAIAVAERILEAWPGDDSNGGTVTRFVENGQGRPTGLR